ncbi:SPOR domain-containing protein [Fictibacillus sp. NRS-1165]|uniref:SPOR domain-containing protein n=1 Tax=Fictibacillus sp. NRS-1165 TaxID=3144463 RepID=UPI003D1B2A29
MKEQKPITVLINGKDTAFKEVQKEKESPTKEIAAAVYTEETTGWEIIDSEGSGKILDFKKVVSTVPRPSALRKKWSKRRMVLMDRNRNTSLFSKKFITAVIAAILTGCTFGGIILMLFTGETASTQSETAAAQQASASSKAQAPATIPSISMDFHAAQNGLFSTKKKAEEISKDMKDQGYAASVYKQGANYSVLIGLGNKKEEARALADVYKLKGVEVWPKQLDASYTDLKIPHKMDEPFIVNGKILLQNVITLSQVPTLSKKAKDSIMKDYEGWKAYGDKQHEQWPAKQEKAVRNYEKDISRALTRLTANRPGEVDWPLQQAVLDSFVSYTKLLEVLK